MNQYIPPTPSFPVLAFHNMSYSSLDSSYRSLDSSYRSEWPRQIPGQGREPHGQGISAYSGPSRQMYPSSGTDNSYYPYPGSEDVRNSQFSAQISQPITRALYVQSTVGLGGSYHTPDSMNGYTNMYQSSICNNTLQHYSHQPQEWSQIQQDPYAPENQSFVQSAVSVSPTMCSNPMLLPVVPGVNIGIGPGNGAHNSWPNAVHHMTGSSTTQQKVVGRSTGSGPEHAVPCPYGCGTVLTGVHAVGNMTRHLKSQNCVASGKDKTRYACPVEGCDKRYIRSDGLKVHLRRRHNISQVSDRTGSSECDETGYQNT